MPEREVVCGQVAGCGTVTQRPEVPAAGYQRWSDLMFLHWSLAPDVLRPHVPESLDIETFDGRAYLGLVPFTMAGVRPWWFPAVPWLSSFPETNVRTYVRCRGGEAGVWFLSLDTARRIAVAVARRFWHLRYFHARMSVTRRGRLVEYASSRVDRRRELPAEVSIRGVIDSQRPRAAVPGSLEHFLVERYRLFATNPDGRLYSARVWHTPYPLQAVRLEQCRQSLTHAAGIPVPQNPENVLFSSGVTVDIFPLKPVVE